MVFCEVALKHYSIAYSTKMWTFGVLVNIPESSETLLPALKKTGYDVLNHIPFLSSNAETNCSAYFSSNSVIFFSKASLYFV